nr:reverse transcriptase domain-containing protein [Tanacetum cinerariifolium]
HHNDWDTLAQRSESSSSITSSSDTKITALKAQMAKIYKNLMRVLQVNQQVKAVTPNYETCGGPHSYTDCPATVGQAQNIYATGAYQGGNSYQPQGTMITTPSSSPSVVERETEVTKDTVHPTNNGSTKDVQPPVVQTKNTILNSEPVVAPFLLVFDSSAIFLAVASLFFWQWEPSSLAVGSSSGSWKFIVGSGNALCILFPTILP